MSNSANRTPSPARLSPEEALALWNGRYQESEYIFGTEPNAYLRSHAGLWQPGQRVLCVADGEGRNSVFLAQQGLAVDAFDLSDVGVAKAKKLAEQSGVAVRYEIADCERYAWPAATYDGVVAIFVQFADPEVRARLFANMVASLKPGGILLLQGYTPQQLVYKTGGPSAVENLYTEDMLRAAFPQMDILELRAYEDDLAEGNHHRGRSALIGLVARKR
ncbi:class I SAM-dependent methyltransferase [Noviherbaspirillum agri]